MENIRLSKLFFILLILINSSISYGFDNSDLEKLKAYHNKEAQNLKIN